jgi:hypothetical protein
MAKAHKLIEECEFFELAREYLEPNFETGIIT